MDCQHSFEQTCVLGNTCTGYNIHRLRCLWWDCQCIRSHMAEYNTAHCC